MPFPVAAVVGLVANVGAAVAQERIASRRRGRRRGHASLALHQLAWCTGYRGPGAVQPASCEDALESASYYAERHKSLRASIQRALEGQVIVLGPTTVPHATSYYAPPLRGLF